MQNELAHYGILGQKWGIRRYQNPDGSLTPEGLERYRKAGIELTDATYASKNYKKAIKVMNDAYWPVKEYYKLSEKQRDRYIRKASDAEYDRLYNDDDNDPETEAKERERLFNLYKYDDLDQGRDGSFKYYLEAMHIDPKKFSENAYKAEQQFNKIMEDTVRSLIYGLSESNPVFEDIASDAQYSKQFVDSIVEDMSENTRGSIGYWYDLLEI